MEISNSSRCQWVFEMLQLPFNPSVTASIKYTDDFIFIYLGDILVYSSNRDEKIDHLRLVFSRLKEQKMYLGSNKYELMKTKTEFWGLKVGR